MKDWSIEDVLGVIVFWVGMASVFLGMPGNIRKNWRQRACGQSLIFILAMIVLTAARSPYAALRGAWGAVPSDAVGFLTWCIVLGQYVWYSSRTPPLPPPDPRRTFLRPLPAGVRVKHQPEA